MDTVRFRLRIFLVLLFAVMLLGTIGFMIIENLSLVDAFYFSIVTIATVGYGDIHPATQTGRILAILLIIMGVGTFLGVVANATEMMLNRRERHARLEKLNMVIGIFFSEVGTKLLGYFCEFDPQVNMIRNNLIVTQDWSEQDFYGISQRLKSYDYGVDIQKFKLEELRIFLVEKTNVMLRLLENPNLLEHESFTELLRAVLHLTEELINRGDLTLLPETDKAHLAGDIKRAYTLLARQWLEYVKYLKNNYPYLFSLAMRTNPFDQNASPVVAK